MASTCQLILYELHDHPPVSPSDARGLWDEFASLKLYSLTETGTRQEGKERCRSMCRNVYSFHFFFWGGGGVRHGAPLGSCSGRPSARAPTPHGRQNNPLRPALTKPPYISPLTQQSKCRAKRKSALAGIGAAVAAVGL